MVYFVTTYFYGYSTLNPTGLVTSITDIDLINADLTIAFNTRKGERVMRPDYGCSIWDYMMEPNIEINQDAIITEVERIVGLDSRLNTINVIPTIGSNSVSVSMSLLYIPFDVVGTFLIEFNNRQQVYFGSTNS